MSYTVPARSFLVATIPFPLPFPLPRPRPGVEGLALAGEVFCFLSPLPLGFIPLVSLLVRIFSVFIGREDAGPVADRGVVARLPLPLGLFPVAFSASLLCGSVSFGSPGDISLLISLIP